MSEEATLQAVLDDLVVANRILANEGVIDAFGHISVRHPRRSDRYVLARSRSPELVERVDLMEFDLENRPIDPQGRTMYSERPIHGSTYKARPDVMAVCHNHARSLIPFGVTGTPIRPVLHIAGSIGPEVPIWDVRHEFGDTDLLVTSMAMGRDLVKTLGKGRTALMRGHGCVVAGPDLRQTVYTAVYLELNAKLQMQAEAMGRVKFLSKGEVDKVTSTTTPTNVNRAWENWCRKAERPFRE